MKNLMKGVLALLVSLCFIGILTPVRAGYPPEGIYGYVYDQQTGRTVCNAYVECGDAHYTTGLNGYYFLSIPVQGSFTVTVTHTGHNLKSGSASITNNNPCPRLDFQLIRANGLSGYVFDTSFVPIAGASVQANSNPNGGHFARWCPCTSTRRCSAAQHRIDSIVHSLQISYI